MRKLLFLPLLFIAGNALADTPQEAFTRIQKCVQTQNPAPCRQDVTASSIALYDRFTGYGLTQCLPQDVAYASQASQGEHTIVRASTQAMGKKTRYMRFAFVEEENRYKLDVPESLRISMGEKWESQVTMTEQLYLAMKQQMGDAFGCQAIMQMAKK